jgi:hypothetical protein
MIRRVVRGIMSDHSVSEEEQIEVYAPWSLVLLALARSAEIPLHIVELPEQLKSRRVGHAAHHGVEKHGLIRHFLGLGLIDRRASKVTEKPGESIGRSIDELQPISLIASEADVDSARAQKSSSSVSTVAEASSS